VSKGTLVAAVALMGLLLLPSWASAELVVATSGSGPDQVARPQGLAVNPTSKLLYAADNQNERVDVWDAEDGEFIQAFGWGVLNGANEFQKCTTASSCRSGLIGAGAGQFELLRGIAVDTVSGAVYVGDLGNSRIQKFEADGDFVLTFGDGVNKTTGGDVCTALSGDACGAGVGGEGDGQLNGIGGVAVGAGGVVYVADRVEDGGVFKTRVQSFSSEGVLLGEILLSVAGGAGGTIAFALDTAGNYIVGTGGAFATGAVRKYDPAGNLIWTQHPSFNINAVATDSANHVFVTDNTGEVNAIFEYDASGTLLRVFYGSLKPGANTTALAPFETANGDIFAGESRVGGNPEGRVLHVDFPPPGPVVYPPGDAANPIGTVRATLQARINPEGKPTTYHFEYVTQAEFETSGWSSPGVVETPETGLGGSDFKLYPAQAQIGCADPSTEASSCLNPETEYRFRVVASNADGTNPGPDSTFTTKPPIEFKPLWSTEVGTGEATLHVEANPVGFPATGYFEYVDDATYQESGFTNASKAPTGAPLDFGGGEAFVERSTFVTGLAPGTTYHYRVVAQDNCKPAEPAEVCTLISEESSFRTFSAVKPVTGCVNDAFRTGAGAYLLDCRAYEMVSPVDKNGVNVEVVFNSNGYPAGLDQVDPTGDKITYSAYRAFAKPKGSPYTSQYMAVRSGEDGWQTESISPPREGASLYNFENLEYQFKGFTSDLCFGWPLQDTANLLAPGAASGYPNLYRRDNCEPNAETYEAVTTSTPEGVAEPRLFYPELQGFSADGSVTFFGAKAKLTPDTTSGVANVYEAEGGSLSPVCVLPGEIVATTGCSLGTGNSFRAERNSNLSNAVSDDGSVVYWSQAEEVAAKIYVRIDGEESFSVSTGPAQFWTAATDGSRAIYTAGEKLFAFDLATKLSTPIAEGVRGLAGWSEDANVLYFVSTKNLAAGATAGQSNFYRYAGGNFKFIGTFAGDDVLSNKPSSIALRPVLRTARVTPDGDQIVFMSKASLTGYDNKDAVSGQPDSEVFLYDADADGGAGDLVCVSCNPSGSRPSGRDWDLVKVEGKWAAAWIPGWTNQLYAPRVISDDGTRVFFNSFDRLEARDTNGKQDVYQWEAEGQGNCTTADPLYSEAAAGCISLISSGGSPQDSELVDSGATGADVFFKTYSSLVSQDSGLIDIYDARVGGGFPPPTPPIPPNGGCEGEACQGPAPTPPAHPAPPQSATFVGPGDVVEPPKKPRCPKGKHRVKRKGKFVCVKNKKSKKASKNRRAAR
jgi:hypothetical protein